MNIPLPAFAAAHKTAILAVASALLLTGAGVTFAATRDSTQYADVIRIVDGDTIDVTYRGQTQRVRLLNIDTPETVDPDEPVQCMGPEATRLLNDRLPAVGQTSRSGGTAQRCLVDERGVRPAGEPDEGRPVWHDDSPKSGRRAPARTGHGRSCVRRPR